MPSNAATFTIILALALVDRQDKKSADAFRVKSLMSPGSGANSQVRPNQNLKGKGVDMPAQTQIIVTSSLLIREGSNFGDNFFPFLDFRTHPTAKYSCMRLHIDRERCQLISMQINSSAKRNHSKDGPDPRNCER